MVFTCPRCGATSYNPNDEAEGYCGRCHAFTRDCFFGGCPKPPTTILGNIAACAEHDPG